MRGKLPGIVRWLLRLYPENFRRAHGDELLEFVKEDAAARDPGRLSRARFWVDTSIDLVRGAVRARRRTDQTNRTRRHRTPLSLGADLLREARHSVRALGKTPLVTVVIVATLALGVGLNTAIFSVVYAVLLEPFPYDEPDALYYLGAEWTRDGGVIRARHAGGAFDTFRRESRVFEDVAAATSIRQNLTDTDRPRQVQVGWASNNLFALLGVEPALGTGFLEDSPPGTLVLSHELWRDRYGSDPDVLGATVRLDDHPYTIAGVLPPRFQLFFPRFPEHVDVWKTPDDWWQNGNLWDVAGLEFALLEIVGRARDGVTPAEIEREMNAFAAASREAHIEYERAGVSYHAIPLRDTFARDIKTTLFVLLGAVGFVLLIACANVMNLMLARSFARGREIAVKLALGASRLRIASSLLTESAVLAALGGAAGVAVAVLATEGFAKLHPENVPRLDDVSIDGAVLTFALAASVASIIVFGLVPAIYAARGHAARDVHAARTTAGRARGRLSRALVVGQLSLSLMLLIGAGLLTKSLYRLHDVSPGFDTENVLTFAVSLPGTKYERPEGTDQFLRQLEERVESLPGVVSSGVVWPLPLSGRAWANTYVGGTVADGARTYAHYRLATPGFFDTLSIPIVDGRRFAPGDVRHVVMVNQRLASRAWPGESAVGRVMHANPWGGGAEEFEVIGVVGDVRYSDLREPARDTIYFDSRGWSWTDWEVDVAVHTAGDPATLVEPVRDVIDAMDPTIPMARVRMMDAYVDDHLAGSRFALSLIGLFAMTAGALAAVGLYGVLSYSVGQRSKEIGVRMALGADKPRIVGWVLGQGTAMIAVGVGLGLVGSYGLTRFLSSFLFDVSATDPWTFAGIAGLLAVVGVVAAAIPAHAATTVEPNAVLRAD